MSRLAVEENRARQFLSCGHPAGTIAPRGGERNHPAASRPLCPRLCAKSPFPDVTFAFVFHAFHSEWKHRQVTRDRTARLQTLVSVNVA